MCPPGSRFTPVGDATGARTLPLVCTWSKRRLATENHDKGMPTPTLSRTNAQPVEEAVQPIATTAFSDEWMEEFRRGDLGCAGPMVDPYAWRVSGYGTNINSELCLSLELFLVQTPLRRSSMDM